MKRFWTLYGTYLRLSVVAAAQFRVDWLIGSITNTLYQTAAFVGIWAIMHTVGEIGGWGMYEIILIYSFFLMTKALSQFFFDNVWDIGWRYVRRGELDKYLVRPAPALMQVLCTRFGADTWISFLFGAFLCGYCCQRLAVQGGVLTVLAVTWLVICGTIITSSLYFFFNSLGFWLTNAGFVAVFVQTLHDFAKYPIHAFSGLFRFSVSYIVPFAFATYYPAAFLLGREGPWVLAASPGIACLLCAAGMLVWTRGLRSYNSAGT